MKRLFVCAITIFFFNNLNAQLPDNYSSETLADTFNLPMGTVFNNDGSQMFVWTYFGQVYVLNWNGSSYVKQEDPVLDISEEVGGWRDFGLLSMCLDPDFDSNGNIYLFYVVDRHHLMNYGTPNYDEDTNEYYEASISRVTRYSLDIQESPLEADESSRLVLLGESVSTGIPILYESHAGGTILFGSDGTLLVTTGDNASYSTTDSGNVSNTYYEQAIADGIMRPEENVGAFRSQMINSLCGKVLRLNPDTGDGMPSNPFYDAGNPRSAPSRMYAMGFRNPFRAAIKPNSGSLDPTDANPGLLFVVDVGWNVWEDLHIIDKPGLNAGWPIYEGLTAHSTYFFTGTTNPDEGNQEFTSLCDQPSNFIDDNDATLRRFTHRRPSVAWRHTGTNDARVPWFLFTFPIDLRVGTFGAPTTGIQFSGNAGVAGSYISGSGFGPDMTDKFLFSDFVRDWVNVATLNPSNTPWISHISSFAPTNYGQGIVHMMQNPLDGSVFYTNLNDGTIRRFSFYDETLNVDNQSFENLQILPNPAKNRIHISGIFEETTLVVFNNAGQKIMSQTIMDDSTIDFKLASGLYFVKLSSKQGAQAVKKLVVE